MFLVILNSTATSLSVEGKRLESEKEASLESGLRKEMKEYVLGRDRDVSAVAIPGQAEHSHRSAALRQQLSAESSRLHE